MVFISWQWKLIDSTTIWLWNNYSLILLNLLYLFFFIEYRDIILLLMKFIIRSNVLPSDNSEWWWLIIIYDYVFNINIRLYHFLVVDHIVIEWLAIWKPISISICLYAFREYTWRDNCGKISMLDDGKIQWNGS